VLHSQGTAQQNRSQQNEIQTLLNQARNYENRNQLTQAAEVYESLYQKYPANEQVVEPYLRVLFLTSDLQKIHIILEQGKNTLPPYLLVKNNCQYLIKTNSIKNAERVALDWLNKNPGQMQHYRDLANIFEMSALFDTAITIYLKARQVASDSQLHALELSNAYYFTKDVDQFFAESIKFLRSNAGFLYYYRSRFREFVLMNPQNIRRLERVISNIQEPEQIWEIYAFALVEVEDFEKATQVYDRLPLNKMIIFSDDLYAAGHAQYALTSYQKAIVKVDNQATLADIQVKIARIYYEQRDIPQCIATLQLVIDNAEIQVAPLLHRTRANKEARLMMALIATEQNEPVSTVNQWYDKASQFAVNQIEKAEILFAKSRYLYLKEEYTQAYQTIQNAVAGHDISTSTYKQSNFYRWEMALFQNSLTRDSLLVECIIYFPEDARVSDMLFLETFISSLGEKNYPQFLRALRYKGLYNNPDAISTLFELAQSLKIDELYLLTYEWILQDSNRAHYSELVAEIENHTFKNEVLKDFIFLQTTRNQSDTSTRANQISDFLNHNPQNVFSPQLRYILLGA